MSRISRIRQEPVIVDKCHESVLCRAHHVLKYVQELLEIDTPAKVILEIIEACYEKDIVDIHETTMAKIKEEVKR